MSDADQNGKNGKAPVHRFTLSWERDLVFSGRTPRGSDLDFDATSEWGCTPVEALMAGLGGCMALDIVTILTKMRAAPSSFEMSLEGVRRAEPPRRFEAIRMRLDLEGEGLTEEQVGKAVALSRDKYCSVLHSLREDLEFEVDVRLKSKRAT